MIITVLLVFICFLVDFFVPLGYTSGFLQIIPLLYCLYRFGKPSHVWWTAGLGVVSVMGNVFFRYDEAIIPSQMVLINKTVTSTVLLIVAFVVSHCLRQHAVLVDSKEEVKRQNAELEQFAYVASHDLKAPLRGISNLSHWIEEDMKETDPAIREKLELMRGRVGRMQRLIDGLLEFSRLRRVHVGKERVNLNDVVSEVLGTLDAPSFNIKVGKLPVVHMNNVRATQIFMNLITNAVKHHDRPDGNIEISCKTIDHWHHISVSDDGPGIDPQYFEKIFLIFQTLKPASESDSTGIGLTLVKRIIEEHEGKIWVESNGRGCKFTFTLPEVK